jgi:hypothetical protein
MLGSDYHNDIAGLLSLCSGFDIFKGYLELC